jgi:hypothetical protein
MISLTEIKSLIDALIEKEQKVYDTEIALEIAKVEARKLREVVIPCALQELGVTKLVLDTGETITLSQEVYASIPADKKRYAFEWLVKGGHSGLIKVDVVASFTKGEYQDAHTLREKLAADGMPTKLTQTVHPQTLKAFLKEMIAKGTDIPLDLFGAVPVFKVNIKK